jgi:hypothetical protein
MMDTKMVAEWLRQAGLKLWANEADREERDRIAYLWKSRAAQVEGMGWQPIDTAPKDGTLIVGWCDHEADPYYDGKKLTVYAAHAEGISHVPDGPHVLEWGGEYSEYDDYTGSGFTIPAWWFRAGSDFEEVANPTHWMALPKPPREVR